MDTDPRVLTREAQIGAALGALGLDGEVFRPLIGTFGPELVRQMAWSFPGDFDRLRVSTLVEGEERAELLSDLLSEVYDTTEDVAAWVREVGTLLGPHAVRIGVESISGRPGEPELRIGFVRTDPAADPWGRRKVDVVLSLLGVRRTARDTLDALYGRLRRDEASEISIALAGPSARPRIGLRMPCWATREQRDEVRGSLVHTAEALGVSERQRAWLGKMVEVLPSGELSDTPVTLTVDGDRVLNELRVQFPLVPATLALRLLSQMHPTPSRPAGAALGALSGAMGIEGDVVNGVTIVAWDGEPPRVELELRT